MYKTPNLVLVTGWQQHIITFIKLIKLLLKKKTDFLVPALYHYEKISKFFTKLPVKRFKTWINFSKSTTYYLLFETYFSVLKCFCMSPDTIFKKKFGTKISDRYSKLSSKVIFNNNLKLHRYTESATVWETVIQLEINQNL